MIWLRIRQVHTLIFIQKQILSLLSMTLPCRCATLRRDELRKRPRQSHSSCHPTAVVCSSIHSPERLLGCRSPACRFRVTSPFQSSLSGNPRCLREALAQPGAARGRVPVSRGGASSDWSRRGEVKGRLRRAWSWLGVNDGGSGGFSVPGGGSAAAAVRAVRSANGEALRRELSRLGRWGCEPPQQRSCRTGRSFRLCGGSERRYLSLVHAPPCTRRARAVTEPGWEGVHVAVPVSSAADGVPVCFYLCTQLRPAHLELSVPSPWRFLSVCFQGVCVWSRSTPMGVSAHVINGMICLREKEVSRTLIG